MSTHPVENPRGESRTAPQAEKRAGLTFRRHFTRAGRHPYDEITWEMRSAVINDEGRAGSSSTGSRCRAPGARPRRTSSPEVLPGPDGRLTARGVRAVISRVATRSASRGQATGRLRLQSFSDESRTCSSSRRRLQQPGLVQRRTKDPQSSASSTRCRTPWSRSRPRPHRGLLFCRASHWLEPPASTPLSLAGGGTASGPVSPCAAMTLSPAPPERGTPKRRRWVISRTTTDI
jgi:hypothetical protein